MKSVKHFCKICGYEETCSVYRKDNRAERVQKIGIGLAYTIGMVFLVLGLKSCGEQNYRMNEAKIRVVEKSAEEPSNLNIRFNKINI